MDAKRIAIVCSVLNMLQFVLSEKVDNEKFDEEETESIWPKKEDCRDEGKTLNDGYDIFLKIYENTLKTSKLFKESSDEDKEIKANDVLKFRKMLGKLESELTLEEKELVAWVKELEALSESSLRRTLNAMINGDAFFFLKSRL